MSVEQQEFLDHKLPSPLEHVTQFLLNRLVTLQNHGNLQNETILAPGLYQKLMAESITGELRQLPFLQKFGGKSLEVVMVETYEPYMYNIGVRSTRNNAVDSTVSLT